MAEAAPASPSLSAERVTVRRGGRAILDDVTLALQPGCFTALVGPNGSGKSTLLRVLAGIWAPDAGRATLDGRPLAAWPRRALARRVAYVPQHPRLDFAFTAREVVAMGRYPHEGRFGGRALRHPAVERAMARCDVATLADRLVPTLSGGEAGRVLLARCLATEARVILLDEPTAALDLRHGLDALALLRALADEGETVLCALHDVPGALRFAHRVAVLRRGRLVAEGPGAEVLAPDLVADVFGVRAARVTGPDGRPALVFGRQESETG